MSTPRIRLAKIEDAPTLADFNTRMALETESIRLEPDVVAAGVRALFDDPAKGRYFVAEIDGAVVGQLMITFEWSDWRNGNIWWIQSVYVDPRFRRRGVFRALYRHVEELARRDGAPTLRLYVYDTNSAAQDTYRQLGMDMAHYRVMERALR